MKAYADLEIGIHRRDAGRYGVDLRFTQSDSDADVRLTATPPELDVHFTALRQVQDDPAAYGKALSETCLFADPPLRSAFIQAYNEAQSKEVPLRLRLFLGPDVPELHDLRWETLINPVTGTPLLTSQRVLFSRYLSSMDWRPVHLRRQSDLSALVVVANPSNLADNGLAPVDSAGELQRARTGLGTIPIKTLEDGERATLNVIAAHLRAGCDILYLVCHGLLKDGESWLWLEDDQGRTARTPGNDLVTRILELPECPRLIVLASCESGGTGVEPATADQGALAALGPRLAEAGVPAVLAMQGNIAMHTIERFMPDFFAALQDPGASGEIDQALAVARGNVRDCPDWWVPVLFMRLKSGRIWYVPGFAGEHGEFEQWRSICNFVRQGRVVPLIGPDIAEHIYGTIQDLAVELAVANGFPLSASEQTDLAKVTQYISTKSSIQDARAQVLASLQQRRQRKALELFGNSDAGLEGPSLLQRIVNHVSTDPDDPFCILSDINARVYVSATANPFMEKVLAQLKKTPKKLVVQWRDERQDTPPDYPDTTPDRPYIYYIFGDLRDEATWVLTEDDFFDYLIRTSLYHGLIPPVISKGLTNNCLLFLGFRLDDWRTRILFRMIMAKGGSSQLGNYNHVGVQVNPDEHSLADVARAKRYLERYFVATRIDIYWGSAADFLQELKRQLARLPPENTTAMNAAGAGEW